MHRNGMAENPEKKGEAAAARREGTGAGVVVRFAPSPTGLLHLGNVRAAVLNWLFARRHGGRFVLRFDDTDPGRVREEYVAAIREDLAWLGLDWDEEIHQSARVDRYRRAAERLKEAGRLYPCYETPEELDLKRRVQRMRGRPPVYDRAALGLSEGERSRLEAEGRRPHWRFLLETDAPVEWDDLIRGRQRIDPASLSDPVLVRADGSFLYLLPSVVDDIELGITHVIRGEDHVTNTAEQIQLVTALGGRPPAFAHFPLLLAADGRPLSKRAGDASLRRLREEGVEPLAIVALLATLGTGRAPESVTSLDALVADFDLAAFSKAAVRLDPDQLHRLSRHALHHLPWTVVADRPELAGVGPELWEVVRGNLDSLADLGHWKRVVAGGIVPVIADADRGFLAEAAELLPEDWAGDVWSRWTAAVRARTGRKGQALFLPLRRAITGRETGPEMSRLLPLIPRALVERRLKGEEA